MNRVNFFPLYRYVTIAFLFLFLTPAVGFSEVKLKITPQYSAVALAPEKTENLNILITIEAPELKKVEKRPPVNVSLVIDRSGSMAEAKKIDYARIAGKTLVNSLDKDDYFALVIYDAEVNVLYPLGPVTDKQKLNQMIDGITPNSMTFLSGGLEEGIKELKKEKANGPSRVILLSDGLANQGITNVEQVAAIGAKSRDEGISVSAIGLGLDFNENMMQHLAQRGGGQYYYINDAEFLPSVFKEELNRVVASFTKDLEIRIVPASKDTKIEIYGYSTAKDKETLRIETSDLSSGEKRQIMLNLAVTPTQKDGKEDLGVLKLGYVAMEDGSKQEILVPLSVDVVAPEADRKELNDKNAEASKVVEEEALLMKADQAHMEAVEEMNKGNVEGAKKILAEQQAILAPAAPENKVIAGKMEQLKLDEANVERAQKDVNLRKSMAKEAQSSVYKTAQGSKQGIMLEAGDTGYTVEMLQTALQKKGFYKGEINGIFSKDVEDAVKAFQKDQKLPVDGIAGPATKAALGLN